jgi:hypothetical protein
MNADVDIGGVIVPITGGEAILRREKREIGILVAREGPATTGVVRRFPADSRAGSARDANKPAVDMSNTYANLQVLLRERRDSNPRPPA